MAADALVIDCTPPIVRSCQPLIGARAPAAILRTLLPPIANG